LISKSGPGEEGARDPKDGGEQENCKRGAIVAKLFTKEFLRVLGKKLRCVSSKSEVHGPGATKRCETWVKTGNRGKERDLQKKKIEGKNVEGKY